MSTGLCLVSNHRFLLNLNSYSQFTTNKGSGFYRENLTLKDVRIFAPQKFFLLGEKLLKSSGITHMVTSNGGNPLLHHLRHSGRLSNSLFNRRTTKQTFTQWPQASALCSPPSGLLGHLFPPQQTEYSHI
jgi:hypothetical protein